MSEPILVGLIGAAATVVGALIGRTEPISRLFSRRPVPELRGKWVSSWHEGEQERKETIEIKRMNGNRVFGVVTSDDTKYVCDVEGVFTGRFLQLLWRPHKHCPDLIDDYGCYFLEKRADGNFEGYAVGFYYHLEKRAVFDHVVTKVR